MRWGAPAVIAALALAARGEAPARGSLAPLPPERAVSTHGPFEAGECGTCHDPKDSAKPGRLLKAVDALCFDCHDEYRTPVKNHPRPAKAEGCTGCHSPHNSAKRKLLL